MLLLTRTLFYLLVKNILPVLDFIIVGSKDKWKNLSMEISDSVLNKIKPVCYALPTIEQLEKCIKDNPQVRSMIVIDPSFLSNSDVRRRINYLRNNNIKVEYLPNIVENYLERVPLEVAKEFASYYEITLNTAPVRYSKRALDIALALLGLIMGLPFMAIIALWILIEDGRPVIFSQQRVGMNNKKYTMHKFRSMKNATSKEKIPAFVTEEGARILNPIGKIIRKTRMDELPQLWDVLIGNMSLIGPRPEQPQFVEQFSDELPFYDYRHHVRPGITGWAQVNFSYAATLEETAKKLEYDLYYVKNWSMLLDLSIILKTVETMLGMKGSK
jgi:exopolysaccharide biosynthesis polyprenyl glycosylphosphotransferase